MRRHRGQTAVGFVVLMGLTLTFIMMTVNLGQMAQVRAATSNAADAAALAGASWMASGNNEAAWMARKMWDGIMMVQAVYLVPFCPGIVPRLYAESLWGGLADVNDWYFETTNEVLSAAWNYGRMETFTAAINNMFIRLPFGESDLGTTGGDLASRIQGYQDYFRTTPGAGGVVFSWNNSLAVTDPLFKQHVIQFRMDDYPRQAVALNQLATMNATYLQYNAPRNFGDFECRFNARGVLLGRGVTFTEPVLPGDVSPFTNVKYWDVDFDGVYPRMTRDIPVVNCEVCGARRRTVPSRRVAPNGFRGSAAGNVRVRVGHEVQVYGGPPTVGGLPVDVPTWDTTFPQVASESTGRYTASTITNFPRRDATAQLSGTR